MSLGSGTLVLALDSLGTVRASGVTNAGRRILALPWPGTWTLRAEHLGFGSASAQAVVPLGASVSIEIVLQPAPIALEGVDASAVSLCGPASRDPEVPQLWEAARALLVSAGGESGRRQRFQVATSLLQMESGAYYHKEDLRDGEFEYDRARDVERDTSWVEGATAFPVEAPNRILREGFILPTFPGSDSLYLYDFHAPHPELILSDEFIATHCFRVVRDAEGEHDEHFGMVGLGFEPNRNQSLEYDVSGVMWLPESTDQWPWIEFGWTRIPEEGRLQDYGFQPYDRGGRRRTTPLLLVASIHDDRFGGRIDLAPIPDAGWIVSRLQVQWPGARRTWAQHLKASAAHKGETPDEIRPYDLTVSRLWFLHYVHEFVGEVLSVQVAEGGP